MEGFKARIIALQEILATSAGVDPLQDRFYVGAIAAYNDLINIDFDEEESPNE